MPRPALLLLISFFVLRTFTSAFAQEDKIVFAAYNLRNYLDEKQVEEGRVKPKTEEEKDTLIKVIRDINPDILGVCEMGSQQAFEDFKSRLQNAGLGYKHFEWMEAADTERHLALVSRHPIIARNPQKNVRFRLNGKEISCKRGFLDVTIQIGESYKLRCVGVHFKSKLPVPEGEALIRRHEATALRQYLDSILAKEPETNLLCYGDFNDTRNEPMFSEVSGRKGAPNHMADLWARDSVGDRWTHYWRTADQYARFDYLFVSNGLWREVVKDSATIYRSPYWFEASDHRPVYTSILPRENR